MRLRYWSATKFTSSEAFPGENVSNFVVCSTWKWWLKKNRVPCLSQSSGFWYPGCYEHLPQLNKSIEHFVLPQILFMQIKRLMHGIKFAMVGQIINVPTDVDQMMISLLRNVSDNAFIYMNLKGMQILKSVCKQGVVCREELKLCDFLFYSNLYQW